MHSPSPSPSSSASLFQPPRANGSLDHLTDHGSVEARSLCFSRPPFSVTDGAEVVTCLTHPESQSPRSSTNGVGVEASSTQQLSESYVRDVDSEFNNEFQGGLYDASVVVETLNGDGGETLQQFHSMGAEPYNHLPMCTSPAPYAQYPRFSRCATDYTRFEPVTETSQAVLVSSLGDFNQFNNLNAAYFSDVQGGQPYIDQHSQASSVQPPFQPSFNITLLPFKSINPIPQRTPCPWIGCAESFVRYTDVQRHWDAVHLGIRYHCFWVSCSNNGGKGYCRLEKLRTHQRQKHGFALI